MTDHKSTFCYSQQEPIFHTVTIPEFEMLEGERRRWRLCVSASVRRGQDEAEEEAGTQETYWAGDSVWIYSMS